MAPKPEVFIDLHLVLIRDGKILMGERRNNGFGAGQYHVPAGHLEPDETIIDGIIREAREETGISIRAEDLELAHVMHFHGSSDRLSLFFTARHWTGEIENPEPEKCAGWHWLPLDTLPANTIAYAKTAVGHIQAGECLGLFGWEV